MPTFGYFWAYCPKSAQRWKSEFTTIPEKLPGHLGIPIDHINHIWSNLPSLKRCIQGCSEIQDYFSSSCFLFGHTLCWTHSVSFEFGHVRLSVRLSVCMSRQILLLPLIGFLSFLASS